LGFQSQTLIRRVESAQVETSQSTHDWKTKVEVLQNDLFLAEEKVTVPHWKLCFLRCCSFGKPSQLVKPTANWW